MRVRVLVGVVNVFVLVAAGLMLPLAGSASAASTLKDDFNGDGYRDLVIGTPKANSVTVTLGSSSGVSPSHAVTVTQNTSGVPGVTEPEDEFGENVTSGDVNGDGFADLIVGAPGERVTGKPDGSVTIIWGGPNGFKTGGMVLNAPSAEDVRFGEGASFVDLDGNGQANLAVVSSNRFWWYTDGVPSGSDVSQIDLVPQDVHLEGVLGGHFSHSDGSDYVLYGTGSTGRSYVGYLMGSTYGVDYTYSVLVNYSSGSGIDEASVAAADLDKNGYDDLVVGDPGAGSAGQVTVWPGSVYGLRDWDSSAVTYDQSSPGVPGVSEPGDRFGASVSADDVTGDGYPEVAVGVPGETVGTVSHTGNVILLKGSSTSLGGGTSWYQGTSGVPGAPEAGDHFGSAVQIKDINRNGRADLALSATGEDIGTTADEGAVWVLRGTSTGLTTSSVTSFSGSAVGVGGAGRAFGTLLR